MAKSTTPTSEPDHTEPPEPSVRPPEHVQLYVAPGMNTISFAELMMGYGMRRDLGEWMEGVTGQIASMMSEISDLRAQVDQLRHGPQQVPAEPTTSRRK